MSEPQPDEVVAVREPGSGQPIHMEPGDRVRQVIEGTSRVSRRLTREATTVRPEEPGSGSSHSTCAEVARHSTVLALSGTGGPGTPGISTLLRLRCGHPVHHRVLLAVAINSRSS